MYCRGRYATTAPGAGCDGTKTAPPRFDADEILNRSIEDFLRACVLWCSLSFLSVESFGSEVLRGPLNLINL